MNAFAWRTGWSGGRLLTVALLVALALVGFSPSAHATPGQGLASISTVPPCAIFNGAGYGIGVAFDGTRVIYTCAKEPKLRFTDLSGANLGSVDTKDSGGNPVAVDAIAWDSNLNVLWGGNLDGQGHCQIWKIDPSTGAASPQFSFTDPSGHCGGSTIFFDGITVDTNTNTLYLSPDINPTIRHFDELGNPLAGDPIPFSTLTSGVCSGTCLNSGLAIGIDGKLFAGTDGDGKIVELDPIVPSFLGQFASVTGRDEDLECGPLFTKLDGSVVETILSRDFETGRIDVLEAPKGTCVTFKLTLAPPTATNLIGSSHTVTATLTANGSPLAGRPILFSVSGVNTGSGSGATNGSGQATFTYAGTNPGTDTITACADINNNGSCDPEEPIASATKTWEAPITAAGTSISSTEGQSFSGTVATFTDPDLAATASEYSATIDWGDSTVTTGTISGGVGSFTVSGTHTYTEEGSYPVTVTIVDVDFAPNTATAHSTATVADAPLSASGMSLLSGPVFSGAVATFTDANSFATTADFTATIDWGDASSSTTGTVSGSGGGPYTVSGSHTYTSFGFFTIKIHIVDDGGSTADATTTILIFGTSAGGNFVIGDGDAALSTKVTFWGAQWSKKNTLSGGSAPAAFKGFANQPNSLPACGTGWSTGPGNSAKPPTGPLPSFMAVLVSSSISMSGSTIAGNTPHIVIVNTNPGYAANPGHAGTGTVVAVLC
jgi:Bacterial Ig-like domain (group 1)